MNLAQDAQAVVVRGRRMLIPHVFEVALGVESGEMPHLDHLRKHPLHIIDEGVADLLLAFKGAGGEVAAVRRGLVCGPGFRKLQLRPFGLAHLGKLPLGHDGSLYVLVCPLRVVLHVRGEELLGELLRLGAVARPGGLAHALAVDEGAHRPDPRLLLLQPAEALGASWPSLLPTDRTGVVCFAGLACRHRRLVYHHRRCRGRLVYNHRWRFNAIFCGI